MQPTTLRSFVPWLKVPRLVFAPAEVPAANEQECDQAERVQHIFNQRFLPRFE